LKRSPSHEIQLDIYFSQHFCNNNYHLRYVVVAVDIFSRFVWLYPVIELDVEKVKNGLLRAISHPGLPNDYYGKNTQ
jgi:hypothetical protein